MDWGEKAWKHTTPLDCTKIPKNFAHDPRLQIQRSKPPTTHNPANYRLAVAYITKSQIKLPHCPRQVALANERLTAVQGDARLLRRPDQGAGVRLASARLLDRNPAVCRRAV